MTTTGGPQDAVPQDAAPDAQAEERAARPPTPPTGSALWRLLAVHVALVLLLVLCATALGDDSCDGRGAWCFSPGDLAGIALVVGGGAALLSMLGATITVQMLARRVRGTGARVLLGLGGGVVTVVVVGSPLTRPYLGL